jgi:formylmethanofuran dehydrogenase subunit A
MFASPRYVIKNGVVVVEEGQLRRAPAGRRLHVRPGYDRGIEADVRRFFDAYSSVSFDNYAVTGLHDRPQALAGGR